MPKDIRHFYSPLQTLKIRLSNIASHTDDFSQLGFPPSITKIESNGLSSNVKNISRWTNQEMNIGVNSHHTHLRHKPVWPPPWDPDCQDRSLKILMSHSWHTRQPWFVHKFATSSIVSLLLVQRLGFFHSNTIWNCTLFSLKQAPSKFCILVLYCTRPASISHCCPTKPETHRLIRVMFVSEPLKCIYPLTRFFQWVPKTKETMPGLLPAQEPKTVPWPAIHYEACLTGTPEQACLTPWSAHALFRHARQVTA